MSSFWVGRVSCNKIKWNEYNINNYFDNYVIFKN